MAFGKCPFCGSDIKAIGQLGLDLIKAEWKCGAWSVQAMAPDTWKGEPNKGDSCETISGLRARLARRAKLAALESVKPLAVLPTITAEELNKLANSLDESQPIRQRERAWCDGINEWFHSRIQPVHPVYLADLVSDAWAASEVAAMACQRGDDFQTVDEWFRARLAAGKGGE